MTENANSIVPIERIQNSIYLIRKQKVMLDKDLAALYGVETKALIQAVMRNIERFPSDFMYQLTDEEFAILRSQIVTSSWGGRRYNPYAFTEQGVAMLSSVLRSKRARYKTPKFSMEPEAGKTFIVRPSSVPISAQVPPDWE